MAGKCSFCGKKTSFFNEDYKTINGKTYTFCYSCASGFTNLLSKYPRSREKGIKWYESVPDKSAMLPELKNLADESFEAMPADTYDEPTEDKGEVNSEKDKSYNPSEENQWLKNISNVLDLSSSSALWISVLKGFAYMTVLAEVIVGIKLLGDKIEPAFIGYVLGAIVGLGTGLVTAAFIMSFVAIAENIKESKQLQKSILKKLEEKDTK